MKSSATNFGSENRPVLFFHEATGARGVLWVAEAMITGHEASADAG